MERMQDARKGRPRSTEAGFTLIEVAVGIAVLVGALMTLALAMVKAYQVERSCAERKIALTFATAQMEKLRSLSFKDVDLAPPAGFLKPATWTNLGHGDVGFVRDIDADGDPDHFGRFFYTPASGAVYKDPMGVVIQLSDTMLAGLNPQAGQTRVAEVILRDPDNATGVTEGEGYWAQVRVFWRGAGGDMEVKLASFIAR